MNAMTAVSAMNTMTRPLILDFDASVLPLAEDENRLALGAWQEEIRFGCSLRAFARLETHLDRLLPQEHGAVFTGSGDFHHLSFLLLRRLNRSLAPASLDLVVCDNHPDNMRYPFGIHCGSWVAHAAGLACIRQIHVLGITSADIGLAHAWENVLTPLLRRKLTYWSLGPDKKDATKQTGYQGALWLALLGWAAQNRHFTSPEALLAAFLPALNATEGGSQAAAPQIYLSIDKDVFSPHVVKTNWDQGLFAFEHIQTVIEACAPRLIGADITGDVSLYRYASRFKRFLSGLDGQDRQAGPNSLAGQDARGRSETEQQVRTWQEAQQKMNREILHLLEQKR